MLFSAGDDLDGCTILEDAREGIAKHLGERPAQVSIVRELCLVSGFCERTAFEDALDRVDQPEPKLVAADRYANLLLEKMGQASFGEVNLLSNDRKGNLLCGQATKVVLGPANPNIRGRYGLFAVEEMINYAAVNTATRQIACCPSSRKGLYKRVGINSSTQVGYRTIW
jgi:hypothetical protein